MPIVLTPGNYTEDACLRFTEKNTKRFVGEVPEKFLFAQGDLTVVMTDLSSKMKILGKPAFVSQNNILHNQRIGRVSFKNDAIFDRYLYHFLRSDEAGKNIRSSATGSMVRHTAPKRILSLEIPLPPLEDQKRIVAVLDEAFAALDRARTHAETNLKNARELFESWAKAEFSKIVNDVEPRTLPDISENLDRIRVPITKGKRRPGSIPYYGASGVVDYVEDFLFNEDLLLISEDGANLLARTYPIAFSISGKTWVNNHAHVLRFPSFVDQEYVRLYLNSISLEPFVSGMAQPKLNQKALGKIPIPFPDETTRKRVVERTSLLTASTKSASEEYEHKLKDLEDLRQSLLQKAFAGELT